MAGGHTHLLPGGVCHGYPHKGNESRQTPTEIEERNVTTVFQSAQYLPPGKISLLHTSQLVAAYLLVTSFSQVAGAGVASLHWLDLVGVLLVVFTLLAVSFEDKIVDIKRWSWF